MTKNEAIDILVGVIAANSEEENEALDMAVEALQTQDEPVICENEGRQAKPVTKGEYMAFKGIKRMSHVDPEETADRDFMELIDTITENTMASVIVIPHEAKDISTNTPTDRPTKSTNIPTEPTTKALKSEPGEDLIKRSDAIEAIELVDWYHQNSNKDMVHGANDDEHQAWYKAQDIYKALETVPSADRPTDEFDGMIFSTDKYMAFIDKKEIHIMRKGACRVTMERIFNTEEDEK